MILTGPEIQREVQTGRITIDPFTSAQVRSNSYDVRVGPLVTTYTASILDARENNEVATEKIPPAGLLLEPSRLYLTAIAERIGSEHFVPITRGRTGLARLGLNIHCGADLVDQGAFGHWTLTLTVAQPLIIYPGMRIGQMTFWRPAGQPQPYDGRYQDLERPQPSRVWRELELEERASDGFLADGPGTTR